MSGEQKRTARSNAPHDGAATRTATRPATRKATRKVARKAGRKAAGASAGQSKAGSKAGVKTGSQAAARNGSKAGGSKAGAKTSAKAGPKVGRVAKVNRKTGEVTFPASTSNGASANGFLAIAPRIERRKSKINGWGVFALEAIPKNKRVIYYAGERISAQESGPREERYLEKGHIWCFQLNRRWVIDAAVGGNIARFINHACKPNCYTNIVDGVIWVRAGKSIKKGEELTYNYYTEGQAEIPCRCVPGCQGML